MSLLVLTVLILGTACWAGKHVHHMEMEHVHHMEMDRTIDTSFKASLGSKLKVSGDAQWANCHPSDPVQVTALSFPGTIKEGQAITVSTTIVAKQDLANPLNAKISLLQKDGSRWDDLCPVLESFFPCNRGNICPQLDALKTCPKQVQDAGWNCKCPLKANTYKIAPFTYPGIKSIPIQGQFNASLTLSMNGKEMACAWVVFSLV